MAKIEIDFGKIDRGPHWLSGEKRDPVEEWLREDGMDVSGKALKYNPNQPRDPAGTSTGGQWTAAGVLYEGDPSQWTMRDGDTLSRATVENGELKPERRDLHDRVLRNMQFGVPEQEEPVVHMLGGGTASGKSTIKRNGSVAVPTHGEAVQVDADELKKELPEYRAMYTAGNTEWARMTHEESSYLAQKAIVTALNNKRSVVYDGTGDSGIEKLAAKVKMYRDNGAKKIVADYATADLATALERERARAAHTSRKVPDAVIRESHRAVSHVFPKAVERGLFDEARLWDTNVSPPKLIAHAQKDKMTVHDFDRYQAFLDKAKD